MKAKITLLLLVSLVMASCSVENEETNLNENTANLETQGGDPPSMSITNSYCRTKYPPLVLLVFFMMVRT